MTARQRTALIERLQKRPNFKATEWFRRLSDDELASFARDCRIDMPL